MNHADVKHHLADYLEGDLPLDARARLDAHLDGCPECAQEVDEMLQTIRLLHLLPVPETPPMIAADVMRRIRLGETEPNWFERIRRIVGSVLEPSFVLPASAIAVAALVVMVVQDPGFVSGLFKPGLFKSGAPSEASFGAYDGRMAVEGQGERFLVRGDAGSPIVARRFESESAGLDLKLEEVFGAAVAQHPLQLVESRTPNSIRIPIAVASPRLFGMTNSQFFGVADALNAGVADFLHSGVADALPSGVADSLYSGVADAQASRAVGARAVRGGSEARLVANSGAVRYRVDLNAPAAADSMLSSSAMSQFNTDVIQGTLDMLILKTLSLAPLHGYGIGNRIEQISDNVFKVNPGSLLTALRRLERSGLLDSKWRETENSRKAKYYSLTRAGERRLEAEAEDWSRRSAAVGRLLGAEG